VPRGVCILESEFCSKSKEGKSFKSSPLAKASEMFYRRRRQKGRVLLGGRSLPHRNRETYTRGMFEGKEKRADLFGPPVDWSFWKINGRSWR
jgi:hypothetical protein